MQPFQFASWICRKISSFFRSKRTQQPAAQNFRVNREWKKNYFKKQSGKSKKKKQFIPYKCRDENQKTASDYFPTDGNAFLYFIFLIYKVKIVYGFFIRKVFFLKRIFMNVFL